MGLRDFLQTLQSVREGARGFRESATNLRQQAAGEQLREQLPDLLRERRIGEIAALAQESGDPTILRGLSQAMIKQQFPQPGEAGLTKEQLSPLFGEQTAERISQAPSRFQTALISATQRKEAESRQEQEAGRRLRQEAQGQRAEFSKLFNKELKELQEQDKQIKNVKDALKQDTQTADAIVFNFVARSVAGEKGPLSDSDIKRLAGRAFGGDIRKLENFVKNEAASALVPEQKQAFRDIVELSVNNFEDFKDKRVGTLLNSAVTDFPLLTRDGEVDPSIKKRAEGFGFKYEDGIFSKESEKKVELPDTDETRKEQVNSLRELAVQVEDPVERERVQALIKRAIDENQSPVVIQKMIEVLQNRIKSKPPAQAQEAQ